MSITVLSFAPAFVVSFELTPLLVTIHQSSSNLLIMARILLLIVLFWILLQVLKRFIASADSHSNPPKTSKAAEKIVQCSQCGLHVPESESQIKNGLTVCSNPLCNKPQQQDQHGN